MATAGEFLQFLVGFFHAIATHDGLDRFGQHFPVGVQIGGQGGFGHLQLAQAALGGVVGQQAVAQGHAHVAQDGGVGQVTLPAADGQFLGQVRQQGIGQAQVAFGVLEVDGVDLVRHGGGTHFAGLELLGEVADGDVAPDVAAQVQQHGVEAHQGVEEIGHVVVRLDLGGKRVEGEAQPAFNDLLREGGPVHVGVGGQVGVVVAHGAVHLAQDGHAGDAGACLLHALHDVGDFLAQGGGRCRLAVGARQHGQGGVLMRHAAQGVDDGVDGRQDDLFTAALEHEAVRGVVDVLGGAGEVDELAGGSQFGVIGHAALQEVLDGLHVVVGGALEGLDGLGVGAAEVLHDGFQALAGSRAEGLQFGQAGIGQGNEPGHFHLHTVAHEGGLGPVGAQRRDLGGVAAIQGRQGIESGSVGGHDRGFGRVRKSPRSYPTAACKAVRPRIAGYGPPPAGSGHCAAAVRWQTGSTGPAGARRPCLAGPRH